MTASPPPLGSHRLLGQGAGAALIRPDGEVDWWCPDRFDSEPIVWSLLDPAGGRSRWCGATAAAWDACPAGPTARTTVRVDGCRVELWDGLVRHGGGSALVRLARPEQTSVTLRHALRIGGFDAMPPATWRVEPGRTRSDSLEVTTDGRCEVVGGELTIILEAPADAWSGLIVCTDPPAPVEPATHGRRLLENAEHADRETMRQLRLPSRHPNRAVDALRVLHALTDAVTGAPVAAPTTSLPEAPGGTRQFDYRFSWLRDSALAVSTAVLLGQLDAAAHYLTFVADVLDRSDGHLTPLTTTRGEPVPEERDLLGIAGWADSRPVRTGNAASGQRQLDALASVLDAAWVYATGGGELTDRHLAIVDGFADRLTDAPVAPTSGVWELRAPVHLVSEELARWHGLDRAIRTRRLTDRSCVPPRWSAAAAQARARVEAVFDADLGRLPQTFEPGDVTPDAANLQAAITGFWGRDDPRLRRHVRSTIGALEQGAFLRRYPPADDGFSGTEATFIPASWWAVTALASIGDVEAARQRADQMCAALPPLLPEEWDPVGAVALGNTPLLWSHMEAARSLYRLEEARWRRRIGSRGVALWAKVRAWRLRMARSATPNSDVVLPTSRVSGRSERRRTSFGARLVGSPDRRTGRMCVSWMRR